MPQCKKYNCRLPAVEHAPKRFCAHHLATYLQQRKDYERRHREMQDCTDRISPDCDGKIRPDWDDKGSGRCRKCQEAQDKLDEAQKAEAAKWQEFRYAETVDELKRWIMEYML